LSFAASSIVANSPRNWIVSTPSTGTSRTSAIRLRNTSAASSRVASSVNASRRLATFRR
jgi:hypothetical protein